MVEIRIHGRGGQGGVTLAKLVATSRFLQGRSVQAFGLYAAERSGAPVQAFCRFDDVPITNRNLIYEPDHVVVLDPTLVGPGIGEGLAPGGWILLNTPEAPSAFESDFPHNRIATVDATAIAREHGLGTRAVPIVNTALAGAVARLLDFPLEEMLAALDHLGFGGGNVEAASGAHAGVRLSERTPAPAAAGNGASKRPAGRAPSLLEGAGGDLPKIRTGEWASEQPHRSQYVPPCNHVCPAGNDVQGFLHALAEDRVDDALEVLLRTSPFPAACGRVCPAPCMASCNRIQLDGAVDVRALERYAGDHGSVTLVPSEPRRERVAVVGSGPAGLAAAYHLGLLGYGVIVYEGGPALGGLLRSGIPEFRLPPDILDREVERILDLGVEVVTGVYVDRERLLALARAHDAVLVATGLQELRALRLGMGDEDDPVEQGIDFLDRVRSGAQDRLDGESVVVVGGGNTAMDAARSALRLGAATVRVVYRRAREQMPAIREEVEEALEEGVVMDFLTQPVGVSRMAQADGDLGERHLICRRMTLGEPDASGRRRPVEVPGSDIAIPCDRVILALGQSPDLSVFPEGTEVRDGRTLLGLLETPVFAVGDLATNEGTVAAAIGGGRRAALHVHQTLTGEVVEVGERMRVRSDVDVWHDEVVRADALRMHLFERAAPEHPVPIGLERRRTTFDEIHAGLTGPGEARRCLSCGVCNECDLCVTYCPEGVLKRVGHDLVFDYAHCKGCGICVTECPRNVVFMSHL
ncbi:MAG TPA: 2-oxoacid:acceptor oxidoreductase family protein [Longimicrobiales bacterium]|nr:2-oxoacid:acceptor oxidoreductase family protein [Longimicrobiales bacterium]